MTVLYLDTSAAVKLILQEDESADLSRALVDHVADGGRLMSSDLLFTELSRVAYRESVPQPVVDRLVSGFHLAEVTPTILRTAAGYRVHVRTLDAIHLATAELLSSAGLRLLTFDRHMAAAASHLRLDVVELAELRHDR